MTDDHDDPQAHERSVFVHLLATVLLNAALADLAIHPDDDDRPLAADDDPVTIARHDTHQDHQRKAG